MRAILVYDKFTPNYVPLHEALNNLKVYEPLFLYNIQPGERFDRRSWLQSYLYLIFVNSTCTYLEITLETLILCGKYQNWKILVKGTWKQWNVSEMTYLYLKLKQ